MKNYLKNALQKPKLTPQTQPIPGTSQVRNSAGGFGWQVSQWERLKRFMVLGSESGTYYATEKTLTLENANNVLKCIQEDGLRAVREIVAISDGGRAPKNDPAIFALALAASHGDEATRKAAFEALPKVCRTGTHLFSFVEVIQGMRGWGRSLRRAVGAWYNGLEARDLAYQLVKYRQRNGWTHTDTLRKSHPIPLTEAHGALYKWVTRREEATWATAAAVPDDKALAFVHAFERIQQAQDVKTVISLIQDYDLPREALPTEWLREAEVWDALLQAMPMTAIVRNLGVMTKVGLLKPMSAAERLVIDRLTDVERLRKARIHPIALLSALRVYGLGYSLKGGGRGGYYQHGAREWDACAKVLDALDTAFNLAFKFVEPTKKATMLALDVSGSMAGGMIAGVPGLTPREGAAAMSMVTARTEPNYMFTAFCDKMVPLNISAKMRLDDVVNVTGGLPFGGTDCALPMFYALDNKLKIETFVVYTDSESWFGQRGHPAQALVQYREKMGIPAKLLVVGMTSAGFTIADPNDAGMLDVVGFDSAAPQVMADFARGQV